MLILVYFGAIAQLGERLHGMQEVVGSNPIGSTSYLFIDNGSMNRTVLACCPRLPATPFIVSPK